MSAQNIISLGIDTSSFTSQKKKVLNEFIDIFNKLEKYENFKMNPVMGDGLTQFNNNLKVTNDLLLDMGISLEKIDANTKKTADSMSSSMTRVRKTSTEAKESIEQTTKAVAANTAEVNKNSTSIEGMGKSLTKALGTLRTLAYILPGIGIAGIFNLAYEKISDAADAMGIFDNELLRAIAEQIELNKEYKEFYETLDKVDALFSNWGGESEQALKLNIEQLKSLGVTTDDILKSEVELAKLRSENAENKFNSTGGKEKLEQLRGEVIMAEQKYIGLKRVNDEYVRGNQMGYEKLDPSLMEEAKSSLERAEYNYKKQDKIVENYYNSINDYSSKSIRLNTFEQEQKRKLILENAKVETDSVKNKNSIILSDERTTLKERLSALEKIKNATQSYANAQMSYIKDRPDYKNADGSLTTESATALNNANLVKIEAERKYEELAEKQRIEFYQRLIKAQSEIAKSELEEEAIKNEKIANNLNKSLDERIEAMIKYLALKQRMQDIERERDLQKGASSKTGKTSLTPEESQEINSKATTLKANIVADQESKIYNIVYSSLRKQFTAVLDEQKSEDDLSKESYIKALENLNAKNLSYEKYQKERKKIDNKYRKEELDAAIVYDEINLDQLIRFQEREISLRLEQAKRKLAIAKASGDKDNIERATGEVNAAEQALTDVQKQIATQKKELDSDRLKRAKLGPEEDKGKFKGLAEYLKIAVAVADAVKKVVDAEYEYKAQQVENWKKLIDEQFGYQQDAIEKSNLTLKDKQALEIQVQQKKIEADKEADRELKRIARDKAIFDRDISVAKIIASTAQGVMAAGGITPAAIAIGAVGAVEIAAVMAAKIPSYKHGTGAGGHKGGLARYGEDGVEIVKEPYKSPYLVMSETISYLPKGTEVIPIKDSPVFGERQDTSWQQTRWLAKQMLKNKQEIKNVIKPVVKVDMNFSFYKNSILKN